jgi:uncharacterized repeat protein (TIGR03803 family)
LTTLCDCWYFLTFTDEMSALLERSFFEIMPEKGSLVFAQKIQNEFLAAIKLALGLAAITLLLTSAPLVAQESILYNFGSIPNDGNEPFAGLVFNAAGDLFGTTEAGGSLSGGTVFELSHGVGNIWTEKVLHNFGLFNSGGDGAYPLGTPIFDSSGNLYGTTSYGGTNKFGTVFELSPEPNGVWKEKLLHSFGRGDDGGLLYGSVVFDMFGNIFGTAAANGAYGGGSVYELVPDANGKWTEKVLHNFRNQGPDGNQPECGLTIDSSGNLYGTTIAGGPFGGGTVFELTLGNNVEWVETIVHGFGNGTDGDEPAESVTLDPAGNLYGATVSGGSLNLGMAFELVHSSGDWTEVNLHNFGGVDDGRTVYTTLVRASDGALYGTTNLGGTHNYGTLFQLVQQEDGSWAETVLHDFNNDGVDGYYPNGGVILDAAGNLYGTTGAGGLYGFGTVFKFAF